jgi:hypothetical protein
MADTAAGGRRPGAGRPRRAVPARVEEEIVRLHGRHGSRRVSERLGVSERAVRQVWARKALGSSCPRRKWSAREDQYLRDHAGEQSVPRLARELVRSESAVRARLVRLGLCVEDLRTDLTATLVAEIIGRDVGFVLRRIGSKDLQARQQDGAWRVWPSVFRDWVRKDPTVIRFDRVGEWGHYLVALLTGDA